MLPWIGAGKSRSARLARLASLFGVDLWRANETKKARSVVALSRVPRGGRVTPVSPPAAGRESKESFGFLLGVGPASCPDSHRPTHRHRHVRNWALAK